MVSGEEGKIMNFAVYNLLNLYNKTKESDDIQSINVLTKIPYKDVKTKSKEGISQAYLQNQGKKFTLASFDDFPALDGNFSKEKLSNGECGKVKLQEGCNYKPRKVLKVVSPNKCHQNQFQNAFGSQKISLSVANKKALKSRLTTSTSSSSSSILGSLIQRHSKSDGAMNKLEKRISLTVNHEEKSDPSLNDSCSCENSKGENLLILKGHAEELVKMLTGCQTPSVIQEIHGIFQVVVIFNEKISLKMERVAKVLGNIGDAVITPGIVFHFAVLYLKLIMEQGFAQYFTDEMLSMFKNILKRNCPVLKDLKLAIQKELALRAEQPNRRLPLSQENNELTEIVQWQCETDNRDTFSSNSQFDGFINPRDVFCELYEEWMKQCERGGENDEGFKKKTKVAIHELVEKIKQHSNYKPFIRLFLSQLLLGSSKQYNAFEKNRQTPGPAMQFSHLAFFKEFIRNIDSYSLQNQMCDSIMTSINQLQFNSAYAQCDDDDDDGHVSASAMSLEDFRKTLCKLRSLGNFFGYLVFDCFKNSADKPGAIENTEGDRLPSMPFSVCTFALDSLKKSLKDGHILPTLTWVVQTLSFIPPNALWLHVGCLGECLVYLVKIYTKMAKKCSFSTLHLYAISTIGFLFERDILGEEAFYHCLKRTGSVADRYTANRECIDKLAVHFSASDLLSPTHWRLLACESLVSSQKATPINTSSRPTFTPRTKKVTTEVLPKPRSEKKPSVVEFEKLYFNMQTSSRKDSVRFLAEKCGRSCRKHLRHNHIYKRDLDHAVTNMIKLKAQEIETDETTAINDIASEMHEEFFPKLKDECDRYMKEYVQQHVRAVIEMDNPDYSDDDIMLTKSIVLRHTNISMESCAFFKNLFNDIKSKVNRIIRRKQKQQEQGEKLDEVSEENVIHVSDDAAINFYNLSQTILSLKSMATQCQNGMKLDLVAAKDYLNEICSCYLPHIYDPAADKLKCSKLVLNRMCTIAFCVREVLIAMEFKSYDLRQHKNLNVKQSLIKLGIGDGNAEQIVWLIKMVDSF